MSRPKLFKDVVIGSGFTPFNGDVGASVVYVKKVNGICPVITRDNARDKKDYGRFVMEGIFWPSDKVWEVRVPEKILNFYK